MLLFLRSGPVVYGYQIPDQFSNKPGRTHGSKKNMDMDEKVQAPQRIRCAFSFCF